MRTFYEYHDEPDEDLPFIFHVNDITAREIDNAHWHESIELLHVIKGSGKFFSMSSFHDFEEGDTAIINSGELHSVCATSDHILYFCLIIDKSFSDRMKIPVDNITFLNCVRDEFLKKSMYTIHSELQQSDPYYRQAVQNLASGILLNLVRSWTAPSLASEERHTDRKEKIVKKAIEVIQRRFNENLSIDDICEEVGYSRYYFCHIFKEYTGNSVGAYLQSIRCGHARSLLRSGRFNVSESARGCGIPNLSHFTKIYKRHMGILPGEELKNVKTV